MDWGTKLFLATVDGLTDDELAAPSLLPSWTRRHLIAHVHYNAEALRRLLSWAATGVENRMYAGSEQRSREIESGAKLHADELRSLVRQSAAALAADMDNLPTTLWSTPVVTAQGRTVPVSEILWMRTREVAVHAIDLARGVGFDDLPADLTAALISDAVTKQIAHGNAAALAAWLTGRKADAPALDRWL